jgi:hypothetical protein
MRIIKLGIISVIVFSLLITGISLFFPSHIRISKAIDMQVDKYEIINQLTDVKNRNSWYSSADSFAVFGRNGKPKLIVEVEKVDINTGELPVNVVIEDAIFPDSKTKGTGWNIIPGSNPNTVTVQWYMDFQLRWYPWEKFSSLLLEKRYGPMMEKGLSNLKAFFQKTDK